MLIIRTSDVGVVVGIEAYGIFCGIRMSEDGVEDKDE